MRLGGLSYQAGTENRFRYNGKELHQELNLGLYNYGARMYDPAIGRWNGVDPLAEGYYSFTPYSYVGNTPMIFIDPNGELRVQTHIYKLEDGTELIFTVNVNDDLISERKVRSSSAFGFDTHDYHFEYDWYDVNETITYELKDGEYVESSRNEEKGDYRTTTAFDLEFIADLKVDDENTIGFGGYRMVSESGKANGREGDKSAGNFRVETRDITGLLNTIGVSMSASQSKAPETLLEGFKLAVDAFTIYDNANSTIGDFKFTCAYCNHNDTITAADKKTINIIRRANRTGGKAFGHTGPFRPVENTKDK